MSANHILVLVIPISVRSHLRLLLQLTLNILGIHPSTVATMLITSVTTPQIEKEMQLQPCGVMTELGDRFRTVVVDVQLPVNATMIEDHMALQHRIHPVLDKLLEGKEEGAFATPPCLVICDVCPSS